MDHLPLDLPLACPLLCLDLRQPERDWRGHHPGLAAWAAPVLQRPSVRVTTSA